MQVLAMECAWFAVKQVPKWWKVNGELGCKYARIANHDEAEYANQGHM
jgi:hypothetical protein